MFKKENVDPLLEHAKALNRLAAAIEESNKLKKMTIVKENRLVVKPVKDKI